MDVAKRSELSPEPDWTQLELVALGVDRALFFGHLDGRPALFARLGPKAEAEVHARRARLEGVVPTRAILAEGPGFVVVDEPAETAATAPPPTLAALVVWLEALTAQLVAAHAVGVAHGGLSLDAIATDARGAAALCWLGLSGVAATPEEDTHALGTIVRALLAPLDDPDEDSTLRAPLEAWVRALTAPRADSRPALAQLLAALRGAPLDLEPASGMRAGPEATRFDAHPLAPSATRDATRFEHVWTLAASPAALWPWVSDTERLNRALGLSAVEEEVTPDRDDPEGRPAIFGRASQAGFSLRWREHPYEWVVGERLGVVRVFDAGPLRWLRSAVSLTLLGDGRTRLVHTLEAEPRGLLGRAVLALELGVRLRLALDGVYRRLDAPGDPFARASEAGFVDPGRVERAARAARAALTPEAASALDALLAELARASPERLGHLGPRALARALDVDADAMLVACLGAAEAGLLVAGWDLVCPSCRSASGFAEALERVAEHGRCAACATDYALDLAAAVELVFQPAPWVRAVDRATYCLSSPAHTPHVAAQVTLAPGERVRLSLRLGAGRWLLRVGAAHLTTLELDEAPGRPSAIEHVVGAAPEAHLAAAGALELVLANPGARAERVRVEAAEPRRDRVGPLELVGVPAARRLFAALPELAPERLVRGLYLVRWATPETPASGLRAVDATGAPVVGFATLDGALGALDAPEARGLERADVHVRLVAGGAALSTTAAVPAGGEDEVRLGPGVLGDRAALTAVRQREIEGRWSRLGVDARGAARFRRASAAR